MISGYTQLLERRYTDKLDPDAKEYIHFAVDGARRMQGLINDLLAYSRISSKARDHAPVDTAEVLRQVLANLKARIDDAQATVEVGALPVVTGDRSQLVQLFQNLVANAVKFARPGVAPIVKVSAVRDGSNWRFTVEDNGIGIEPQYHDRIFVVFQRLHSRDKYEGTGVGLAICKKVVERHGGRIWLESKPGEGTAFHFMLPA
jgi:light-regulated signal transduction histidine kinase (bacteriophytochrome)